MSDTDTRVRSILRDLADQAPVDPILAPGLKRRVKRRRATTVAMAGGVAAVLVAGTVFGVTAAVRARGNSTLKPAAAENPTFERWPGLYPAVTQGEGEALQACVDAGGDGSCVRLVGAEYVIRSYAKFHLGWSGVYFTDSVVSAEAESGPVTLQVGQCLPIEGKFFPTGCTVADVTVERLLRHDARGVWFVIGASEYTNRPQGMAEQALTEAQVKAFVEKFMQLRMEGAPQALDFLSSTAKSQYDRGDGGLFLFGEGIAGNRWLFEHFEISSIEAADANSYEVKVSVIASKDPGDGNAYSFVENLFVGPGQDYKGEVQPLVIRGAALTSLTPLPAP
jgi:hypothetical protein